MSHFLFILNFNFTSNSFFGIPMGDGVERDRPKARGASARMWGSGVRVLDPVWRPSPVSWGSQRHICYVR